MMGEIRATTLRNEVVEQLRKAILRGEIPPDARLNERQISEQLGISRPPLREAIRQLESEGLIISFARRGSFVRSFSAQDVREIYATRYALEAAAAEIVAESVTPEIVRNLEQRLLHIEEMSIKGIDEAIEADFMFHRALVAAAGMTRLSETWERLVSELRLALCLVDSVYFEFDFIEQTHRPLVDAIIAKDKLAIRTHLEQLRAVGDGLGARWDELSNSKPKP